jgi:arylsulfatase A-like enzyme
MKYILFVSAAFWLASQSATCAAAAAPLAGKPNLVVIFIDDMGYGDIGPYGSKLNRTPHLDRMAAEGMKLTSFYAAPVCSVSRAQLLTGCYGARVSVPGVYFPGQAEGLNPQEDTIADLVKPQGYATMCIGKWHLGDQPEFLPTKQGFDHYLGIPYSNDMQRKSLETGERVVPLVRDDQVAELLTDEAQTTVTERYTDEAVKFIRQHHNTPFFLYFPHTAVHTPIFPGAAFQGKSANGRYGDWVEEVDASVGRVLDTLRELKLEQNTLVIFTSDNGPWLIKGSDGGTAGPLRGGKGSTWEGGVRVPTVAWWPGRIAAGETCDAVAGTIDLLPTLVNLAHGKLPADRVIDGRDIGPLLWGQTTTSPREAHYYFAGYTLQAVRQGPWKLALTPQPETMGRGVSADAAGQGPRLYNLDDEIGEQTNVAAQHPDIVARLQDLAAKMNAELGGPTPPGRRPAGHVENPVLLYPAESPPRAKKTRPAANATPVSLDALKMGDSLTSDQAPQVAGRAITITCEVEPQPGDGVIVSHGGSAMGYTLYLKDNRAVFAVRHAKQVTRVTSPELPAGRLTLQAQLTAEAVLKLSANGQSVEPVKAPGPLAGQPMEDFDVGFDAKNPVDDYDGSKRFRGTIRKLAITVGAS